MRLLLAYASGLVGGLRLLLAYASRIEYHARRRELHQKVRDRLKRPEGRELHGKRGTEVETVFGQVKGNWGFRRFTTRGIWNVSSE
ncbi:MAG: transposase [Salinispira sp.]